MAACGGWLAAIRILVEAAARLEDGPAMRHCRCGGLGGTAALRIRVRNSGSTTWRAGNIRVPGRVDVVVQWPRRLRTRGGRPFCYAAIFRHRAMPPRTVPPR